jgi:hypothetical protein
MLGLKSSRTAVRRACSFVVVALLCVGQNRRLSGAEEFVLTGAGLLHFTNVARHSAANLEPLVEAADLTAVAQARLKDMLDRQYFSHTSPVTGEGAPEIAERIGYKYLSIAENIARGYFQDDQELVRVWMESLRHRQNIVSPGYTEIGVAVGRATLAGLPVWIGVQVFARPLSDCPQPDDRLRGRIDSLKSSVAAIKSEAAALQAQLGNPDRRNSGEVTRYNSRVTEYNALIGRHNALAAEIRHLTAIHNLQTNRLASCAASPVAGRNRGQTGV